MSWDRVIPALVVALLSVAGYTVKELTAPATVPSASYTAVVQGLARMNAEAKSEVARCLCKYRRASSEAVSRGWVKPTTRSEWDAVCQQDDEGVGG